MDIIDILAGDSYIIYNKEFAKKYGVESAILLGAMCGYQKGFRNEYFYREQNKILEDTALTAYALRGAIKMLQGLGIIEYEKRGMPAKYYYKVNAENLEMAIDIRKSRVVENDKSRDCENNSSRVVENDSTYKNNNNNNDKNKNNNKEEDKPRTCNNSFNEIINNFTGYEPLRTALIEYVKMRKLIKKPLTSHALQLCLTKKSTGLFDLSGGNDELAKEIVNQSICNSWQGLYPLKKVKADTDKQESIIERYARL